MNPWIGWIVSWLADVYLLSTVVLTVALVAMRVFRQPARRLAIARAAFASLVVLIPLAAGALGARAWWQFHEAEALAASSNGIVCTCPISAPAPPSASGWWRPIDPAFAALRAELRPAAIFTAYAVASAAVVAWLGVGAIAAGRLRARESDATGRLYGMLARIVGDGRRPPRLLVSARVAQPVAVGLINPTIILPGWFTATEPDGRIEAALRHEWTHIRNGDLWTLAVSRLLLPLLFLHPLFLWVRRRVRADQEALADAAGAEGVGPIAYAEALFLWARARADIGVGKFVPSLGLWSRPSSLTGRVALLLDRNARVEPRCPRVWSAVARIGLMALTAALGLGLMTGSLGSTLEPARPVPHVHVDALEPGGSTTVDCKPQGVPWRGECCR